MWSLKDTPIRRKSTLVALFTSVIALISAGFALFFIQVYTFRQDFVRDLSTLAKSIAQNSRRAVAAGDPEAAAEVLGFRERGLARVRIEVYRAANNPL